MGAAVFLIGGAAPLLLLGIAAWNDPFFLGFTIAFWLLAVMSVVSVTYSWLAISKYGIEVSVIFWRAYTPWKNIAEMLPDHNGFLYAHLHASVRYELWPIKYGGMTRRIPIEAYGTDKDNVLKQIRDHIY